MTAAQRQEIRDAVDQSRREYLEVDRARLIDAKKVADKARSDRDATVTRQVLMPLLVTTTAPKPVPSFCVFCGVPAPGGVCRAHADLDSEKHVTAGGGPTLDSSQAAARRR